MCIELRHQIICLGCPETIKDDGRYHVDHVSPLTLATDGTLYRLDYHRPCPPIAFNKGQCLGRDTDDGGLTFARNPYDHC